MPSQKPIVVVGSINLDLVAVADKIPAAGETLTGKNFQIHPGGKGANQAVAVARLGYPVRMIGRLGNDVFAAQLREHLEAVGVDVAGVATSEGASGVALIVVSSSGENSIVVAPGANAKVAPEDINKNLRMIREAGVVLTQLEVPLETVDHLASICARENVPLILDPAPARELPEKLVARTAWFTPNESEAEFYSGNKMTPPETASSLIKKGCNGIILKMGSNGVYLVSPREQGHSVPAFAVRAIDTTAAGDAFNGAFAVGLMQGKAAHESAVFASAVAAISVTRIGAQPSMPTMPEVQSFLSEHATVQS